MQSPREIGRTCMTRLDGKVVLITGAARGLGAAAARVAIQRGAKVMLVDTRDELGTQLAAELGDAAAYVHSDVREESDWANAVSVAESRFGHLDVLVNNAAVLRVGLIEDFSVEDLRALLEVNQVGPFLGMRAVIPAMRAVGRGSIINVGSTDALHGMAGVCGYSGTKWALRGMTKVAAQELGPLNIRVNAVHPGGIRTEMSTGIVAPEELGVGDPIPRDRRPFRWPLQRIPQLEEVANVIVFLASEEATYTTGQDIACDGGATIGPRYVNV